MENVDNHDIFPTQEPKDIVTTLPPGLLGDPLALPRCPLTQVTSGGALCPADTQVGVYLIHKPGELLGPIVNVTPEAGQSAEFALENTLHIDTPLLTAHLVRTTQGVAGCTTPGGCYGFTVVSNNIPNVGLHGVELTFWGVPGDPSHDPMRGLICKKTIETEPFSCVEGTGGESYGYSPVVPFLTMGTDCGAGPEGATVRADSWEEPGVIGIDGQYGERWTEQTTSVPAVTGCESLRFDPSVGVEPDTSLADEPVGLGVNVNVPLNESPTAPATPQLRNTVLTLPEGMSVSPGVVDGIRACEAEGPEGINIEGPGIRSPSGRTGNGISRRGIALTRRLSVPRKRSPRSCRLPSGVMCIWRSPAAADRAKRRVPTRMRRMAIFISCIWNLVVKGNWRIRVLSSRSRWKRRRTPRRAS